MPMPLGAVLVVSIQPCGGSAAAMIACGAQICCVFTCGGVPIVGYAGVTPCDCTAEAGVLERVIETARSSGTIGSLDMAGGAPPKTVRSRGPTTA